MVRQRVGGARVKWSRAIAAVVCAPEVLGAHGAKGLRGRVFGQWCACGAVQAISLACYAIYDVYGSGPSRNFAHCRF